MAKGQVDKEKRAIREFNIQILSLTTKYPDSLMCHSFFTNMIVVVKNHKVTDLFVCENFEVLKKKPIEEVKQKLSLVPWENIFPTAKFDKPTYILIPIVVSGTSPGCFEKFYSKDYIESIEQGYKLPEKFNGHLYYVMPLQRLEYSKIS